MRNIPDIRKGIKIFLKEKGFSRFSQDGSHLFSYKELSQNRLSFCFSIKTVTDGISLSSSATFVSNEIGDAINRITGKRHTVFPSNKLSSIYFPQENVSEDDVEKKVMIMADEALSFAQNTSFDKRETEILATIDLPGSHQQWHIAALAAKGDVRRLTDLLAALGKEGRGGLFPYIKKEFIEAAIDYSGSVVNT